MSKSSNKSQFILLKVTPVRFNRIKFLLVVESSLANLCQYKRHYQYENNLCKLKNIVEQHL